MLDIRLPREGFPTSRDRLRQQFEILTRVRMLPGVLSAGASTGVPMAGTLPESTMKEGSSLPGAIVWRATPGFISSLGATVVAGTDLLGSDMAAVPSAILSESFAKAAFQGKNPVGSLVELGTGRGSVRVVGVIADVRHALNAVPVPTVFVTFRSLDDPAPSLKVLVRAVPGQRDAVSARIGAGMEGVHPLASVAIHPFAARLDRYLNYPRAQALLAMSLASTVVMFAVAGVYAIAHGFLLRRRREFAIQLALGSTGQRLRQSVWRSVRTPVLLGTVAGIVLASVANGTFVAVFGQRAGVRFGTLALALIGVLLPLVLVAYSVARDVSRIDPVQILK